MYRCQDHDHEYIELILNSDLARRQSKKQRCRHSNGGVQLPGTTGKRRNEAQDWVVRVALDDVHVQGVQALAHNVQDAGCDFTEVIVLEDKWLV